jgi:eukaryotic-like serine/threonine-protein kinase
MDVEPHVQFLLEEMLDSGHTPEEACRDCPELLPLVLKELRQKLACDAHLDALFAASEPGDLSPEPPSAEMPQIPGHELDEVLGRGGMGVVYRARHVRLNRTVAIKMLLNGAHGSPEARERFMREAEAVAGLRHPNIVQVYELGDQGGQPYFTMEFIEGGNLARKLAGTPQPPRHAATLQAALAVAVEAAHRSGIVHRDLKPSNVLLTADGTPKISDFGLARRLDGEAGLTWTGIAVGTPSYMAPEQAEARPLTWGPAVDLYALGSILYELLTGRPPFRAATAAETVRQVISQDPVPPSRLNGTVPRDLETICLKCLHKEPHLRYAGAAELAADLHRFLSGEAIAARPDGRLAWLARRIRRRPVLSAVVALAMLFTVALLGSGLWLISDRAAVAREAEAERVATDRAAGEDLRDMAQRLKQSSWPEAHAALERAKGRLGGRGSAELRRLMDQGTRDLELVARFEAIQFAFDRGYAESRVARPADQFNEAFHWAGIGQRNDDPEVVADRVRKSNIKDALVAALDDWSGCISEPRIKSWVLAVARKADPDSTGWRDRARDPVVQADQVALVELIKSAPVTDHAVSLFLALDKQLDPRRRERLPFLTRIQQAHPGDFSVNCMLGAVLIQERKATEAIRYFQAAVSLRPELALGYDRLGGALCQAGRMEDAVVSFRQAADLDPTSGVSHARLSFFLSAVGRHDEAISRLQMATRSEPNTSLLYTTLGHRLEFKGRYLEALAQHRRAIMLDPKDSTSRRESRAILTRLGRGEEARAEWQTALESKPLQYDDWSEYAEFCLLIGHEEEYRRARRTLLGKFGMTNDPHVAERTARACLLLPATEDELRQVVALTERALCFERPGDTEVYSSLLFARGFAEYRRGRFDRAISTMRGEASRYNGSAPRLVLAMALHRSGQIAESRKTLAAAVLAHNWKLTHHWKPNVGSYQAGWLHHVLRREAEQLILSKLPDFLAGTYRPEDNDERLALLGVCQSMNRIRSLAGLYAEAFAANPKLAEDEGAGHRYNAACAAALASSGQGEDAGNLSQAERTRWRKQARSWLALDLAAYASMLDKSREVGPSVVWPALFYWPSDLSAAGLREPGALEKLSVKERDEWLSLWKEHAALLIRATGG